MRTAGLILLAEDEVMVRNLIRRTLQNTGYDVLVAADGSEAVTLSQAHEGTIDLLLTDVEMPHIDGISAYREILAERPNIKVLFMSGGMSGKLELPPLLPFLQKPFEQGALSEKVDEILAVHPPAIDLKVIFVVDHDASRREHTKGILTDNGYAVLLASSVEEAEAVADSIARIDLIVSEVLFTGESGVHLAEHVKASERGINTLLISHFDRDLLRDVRGFSRQPEFLSNPFTPEALLMRVRRLLKEQ
jgi:DNA-binding response OmpR family regulator